MKNYEMNLNNIINNLTVEETKAPTLKENLESLGLDIDEIMDYINDEISKYNTTTFTAEVWTNTPGLGLLNSNSAHVYCTDQIAGLTDPKQHKVVINLNGMVKNLVASLRLVEKLPSLLKKLITKSPEKVIKELLHDTIVHEFRHAEQMEYLESKGINADEKTQELIKKHYYFTNPMEIDAFLVQLTGIRLPMSFVASFF